MQGSLVLPMNQVSARLYSRMIIWLATVGSAMTASALNGSIVSNSAFFLFSASMVFFLSGGIWEGQDCKQKRDKMYRHAWGVREGGRESPLTLDLCKIRIAF